MTIVSRLHSRATVPASIAIIATAAGAILRIAGANPIIIFVVTALALGSLAALVGQATEQLGTRLGPGPTGAIQSALGNLPELFISIFALRAGLTVVVQTALLGSILANSLLVLGLAFFIGGIRNGTQKFRARAGRRAAMLLVLSVASLAIPTLATAPGAPDFRHAESLSVVTAIVLLMVFAGNIPLAIRGTTERPAKRAGTPEWPLTTCIMILAVAGVGAGLVSDWFVDALTPTMAALGISEEFAGLVIVAIAGNAVENVVGITAAARNDTNLALSLILNSSLQVSLFLLPALVLFSAIAGGAALTLVVPPLLIAALALTAILTAMIIFDGESNYVEGMALIGLYVIIAASVWYGAPIKG